MAVDLQLGGTPLETVAPVCRAEPGCITCGDVAVILTVLSLETADALCRDDAGRTEAVAIELVEPVTVGERLLVHAGVALQRLGTEGGAS